MRFLIDTQLPAPFAKWLGEQGHSAVHALDLELGQGSDAAIWACAQKTEAMIVTKAEVFAEWAEQGRSGPQIVWLGRHSGRARTLIERLEVVWPDVVRQLQAGTRLVEVPGRR